MATMPRNGDPPTTGPHISTPNHPLRHLLSMPPITSVVAYFRWEEMAGSGSDGPIFDSNTNLQSHGGGSGNDGDGAESATHYIYTLSNICHELMYENFGVLDWCYCYMKNNSCSINNKIDDIFKIYNKISLIACP